MNMPLWGDVDKSDGLYTQERFHIAVLITCLVLIPIMLIPVPLIKHFRSVKIDKKEEKLIQESYSGVFVFKLV